jgi:hypothetical protein
VTGQCELGGGKLIVGHGTEDRRPSAGSMEAACLGPQIWQQKRVLPGACPASPDSAPAARAPNEYRGQQARRLRSSRSRYSTPASIRLLQDCTIMQARVAAGSAPLSRGNWPD